MKLTIEARPPRAGAVRVQFLTKGTRPEIVPPASELEFSGKANQVLFQRDEGRLFVGLGDAVKLSPNRLRRAAGAAVMFLKRVGLPHASFALGEWARHAGPAVEGAILADYRFERFKEKKVAALESLHVEVSAADLREARAAAARGKAVAEAANYSRSLANLPGNLFYPEELAAEALRLGRKSGLKVRVFDEKQLAAGRFGGILAVGAGSVRPPRLIVLEHRGGKKDERPLALVGKAITFDSGGISIKPAANMEEMIFDKTGGISVLGAMAAIAELGLKRNVVGVIASAENMPSAGAYRPGDIVTAYDGTHIEVINTDAEGRVVLGDAIAYARQDLRARAIIDLATLTGACGVALGEHAAGLWYNDVEFGGAVQSASERAGERVWPMPSFGEYDDEIRSEVADLKNAAGRRGGACTAAAFLKAFARDTPWAHLDIAAMASHEKDQSWIGRGASGYGVRLLVELAEGCG